MQTVAVIAEMIGNQRGLTKWYLKKINQDLIRERIEVNGKLLNSPYWLAGHIVWADQFLCLSPLGLKTLSMPWIKKFQFSGDGEVHEGPEYAEIYNALKASSELVQDQIRLLSEDQIMAPFPLSELGFLNTKFALYHLIRHEGIHCGQLSWFCAMKKIKTI